MKKLLFILTTFVSLAWTANYSLVYVHIGERLPHFLDIALDQALLFNKECNIYLIANTSALDNFEKPGIKCIPSETLKKTQQHRYFQKTSTHNTSFRNGFWRYATERFFLVDELAQKFNLENIIHVESDNMLYVDFTELLPILKKEYKGIGAVFSADDRCIPSVIYFSNKNATKDLTRHLAKISDQKLNDMRGIAHYKNSNKDYKIDFLPSVPVDYAQSCPMNPIRGAKTKNKMSYCNHFKVFNSVFDTQAIGQYLGGQDHRNSGNSFPGQINAKTTYIASDFSYEWILDNQQRAIPYLIFKGKKYRINNIHVHSKDLCDFYSLYKEPGVVKIPAPPKRYLYVL